MQTEELKENVEDISKHVGDYIDTFFKLATINLTQKAATVTSSVIHNTALCIMGLFVLFFAGFGAAWWLGDVIDSRAGGFLIVAGFFLLLTLIFVALRKQVIFPLIRNKIIREIYD